MLAGKGVHRRQPVPWELGTFGTRIARRLSNIYKSNFSEGMVNDILRLCNRSYPQHNKWDERDAVIITYGNTVRNAKEKPLKTLGRFIKQYFHGYFTCIHILPFFPSTSDDGFAVSDYYSADPALGSWEDILSMSSDFDLMADLVINHVSASHPWFKKFLNGDPRYKTFFIEKKQNVDYRKVTRPRNTPLFTPFVTVSGEKLLWTTFSKDQVDLNFSNPSVLMEIIRVLLFYVEKGIRIIRLDAVAYIWKQEDTSCIHLPETHEIIKLLREIVSFVSDGVVLLAETNVPNVENWSYFGNNDEAHMVYQFTLPPLLLYTMLRGHSGLLTEWAAAIPGLEADQTFLNFTASHDGIGVRPVEDILPAAEVEKLYSAILGSGGQISRKVNADGSLHPYEMNITYFDALRNAFDGNTKYHEIRFMTSQMIMMAMKGIPAFYIHSVLGTSNDYEAVRISQKKRAINRHQYAENELTDILVPGTINHRIFHTMLFALKVRRKHSAFHPDAGQHVLQSDPRCFTFVRDNLITGEAVLCISNITSENLHIHISECNVTENSKDLLSEQYKPAENQHLEFQPYQTRWILIQSDVDNEE